MIKKNSFGSKYINVFTNNIADEVRLAEGQL
jgi:hypothetical protein